MRTSPKRSTAQLPHGTNGPDCHREDGLESTAPSAESRVPSSARTVSAPECGAAFGSESGGACGQHRRPDRDAPDLVLPRRPQAVTAVLTPRVLVAREAGAPTGGSDPLDRHRRVEDLDAREREELGVWRNVDDLDAVVSDVDYLAACQDITYWNEQGVELHPADRVAVPSSVSVRVSP
ncbi:MAG: hypothetical protein EOO40_09245 [Deltaproteobacteria bacterium]|nr:MAG: hypothetical protein EOO40_09245 [Deltaproteobacteria bacterium]